MKQIKEMQGLKFDSEKPDLTLVPTHLSEAVARVMMFGASKYGRNNWRLGMEHHRLLAATMRHINKFLRGEEFDEESGMPHLWHAACDLAFLIEYQQENIGLDDLRKPPCCLWTQCDGVDGSSVRIHEETCERNKKEENE